MEPGMRDRAANTATPMKEYIGTIEQLLYELATRLDIFQEECVSATSKDQLYTALESVDATFKAIRVTTDNADSYITAMGRSLDPVLKQIDEVVK